jgi:hypothetical protein
LIYSAALASGIQSASPLWLAILKQVASQWIALITFFAFPVIQYIFLRTASRRKGQPELWYLPAYGFRLVIRNLPYKKVLTDIKYRTFVRSYIPGSAGSSVATLVDRPIFSRDDTVLFPGTDQILLSFNLRKNSKSGSKRSLALVITDKMGAEEATIEFNQEDRLVCDYSAVIQDSFNFNVQTGKRVEINGERILDILKEVEMSNIENRFPLSRIRNIY